MAVKGASDRGFPESIVITLGGILLICALLYAYPKTSVIGAVLITAWLGGAVATHIIYGDTAMISVVFGIIVWMAIWLRNTDLKFVFPMN
jgi:hypothetical protein